VFGDRVGTEGLGDGSPPVESRGRAPVGVWGKVPRSQICIYRVQPKNTLPTKISLFLE